MLVVWEVRVVVIDVDVGSDDVTVVVDEDTTGCSQEEPVHPGTHRHCMM